MKSEVNLIAAVARNGVIGRKGEIPWRLPQDLRHFHDLTIGHPVIMGLTTHRSIGRVLAGRTNIVLTSSKEQFPDGVIVAHSFGEAMASAAAKDSQIFVIGGEGVYRTALPVAERVYFTEVDCSPEDGDTFFPEYERFLSGGDAAWRQAQASEWQTDEQSGVRYRFMIFEHQALN